MSVVDLFTQHPVFHMNAKLRPEGPPQDTPAGQASASSSSSAAASSSSAAAAGRDGASASSAGTQQFSDREPPPAAAPRTPFAPPLVAAAVSANRRDSKASFLGDIPLLTVMLYLRKGPMGSNGEEKRGARLGEFEATFFLLCIATPNSQP
jgi:hypothetical protein